MMVVIVTLCAAFGVTVTVSETTMKMVCWRRTGVRDTVTTFRVDVAGWPRVQKHTVLYTSGELSTTTYMFWPAGK